MQPPQMPATPDFDQIARRIAATHADQWDEDADGNQVQVVSEGSLTEDIRAALLEVWNARGAADTATITAAFASGSCPQRECPMEAAEESPAKNLDRAVRALDR